MNHGPTERSYTLQPLNEASKRDEIAVGFISLTQSPERRRSVEQRKIPPWMAEKYFPASDLRRGELSPENKRVRELLGVTYSHAIKSGEVGCRDSHMRLMEAFLDRPGPEWLMVLEDDVTFALDDINSIITKVVATLESQPIHAAGKVCHLGLVNGQDLKLNEEYVADLNCSQGFECELLLNKDIYPNVWRTHGYILDRRAACEYLDLQYHAPFVADDWRRFVSEKQIAFFFCRPGVALALDDLGSTIRPSENFFIRSIKKMAHCIPFLG